MRCELKTSPSQITAILDLLSLTFMGGYPASVTHLMLAAVVVKDDFVVSRAHKITASADELVNLGANV